MVAKMSAYSESPSGKVTSCLPMVWYASHIAAASAITRHTSYRLQPEGEHPMDQAAYLQQAVGLHRGMQQWPRNMHKAGTKDRLPLV